VSLSSSALSLIPTQPEATSYSVERLLELCQRGELVLPAFQRGFRWKQTHRVDLMDSIFRGYPIGSLLLWEPPEWHGKRSEWPGIGPVDPGSRSLLAVVDGQQRVATLLGTLADRVAVPDEWRMYFDTGTGRLFYLEKGEEPDPWHMPLAGALNTMRYLEWLQSRPLVSDREARVRLANALVRQIRDYRIPAYVVRGADESALREVFDRMNTRGVPLTAPEVFNALFPRDDGQRGIRDAVERIAREHGEKLKELEVLKALMAVTGMDVTRDFRAERRRRAADLQLDLDRDLGRALAALGRVIEFLTGPCEIPTLYLMPYRVVLPVLVAWFDRWPDATQEQLEALRRWFWSGCAGSFARANNSDIQRYMAQVPTGVPTGYGWSAGDWEHADTERWDLREGRTKVVACALASSHPRELSSGEALDVRNVVREFERRAFQELSKGWTCRFNRFLHAPTRGDWSGASQMALESHGLTQPPHSVYFGLDRGRWLNTQVLTFLRRLAGPESPSF
jgi:hypothetical protein